MGIDKVLSIAAMVICLSGCGGGGSGDNSQPDSPPVGPSPPTDPPPDPPTKPTDPVDENPPTVSEAASMISGQGALNCGAVNEDAVDPNAVPYEQMESCVAMAVTQGLPFVAEHFTSSTDTGAIDALAFDGERLFTLYALSQAGAPAPSSTELAFRVSQCVLYRVVARGEPNAGIRGYLPIACSEIVPIFYSGTTWEPGMLDEIPERLGTLIDAARFLAGGRALDCREALYDGNKAAMYNCVVDAVEREESVFSVIMEGGTDSLLYYGFASDGATHYTLYSDTYNCFGLGGPSACFSVSRCIEPLIRSFGVSCGQYEPVLSVGSPESISTVIELLVGLIER